MIDGLKAKHRAAIIATLAANHRVERAVLFGSRAMGTNTITSDVDIALFGQHLTLTDQASLAAACEELSMAQSVDLVLHSAIDNPALVEHIRSYGVEWYRRGGAGVADAEHALQPSGNEDSTSLYQPSFPNHWIYKSLYSMAHWVNGLAFKNIRFTPKGKPVIKISEIKNGISGQTKFTQSESDESVRVCSGDLLFSWSGQPETSIDAFWWRGPEGWLNQHIFRVTPSDETDQTFFFYLLRYLRPNFIAIARNKQTTGLGHVTKQDLQRIVAAQPPLSEQRSIAHILGTLDDKIELNRRMNETLEAMARALFKDWFVDFGPVRAKAEGREAYLPEEVWGVFPDSFEDSELGEIPRGWGVKPLSEIATFLNGLALQKYPATSPEDSLPVIKIAELRNGISAKTDKASRNIPKKYIVTDGDFLFSWSGSLMAEFWTEGEGAVNQHLFKVTSDQYPPWFFAGWVRFHLDEFQRIAASKATTMGHIQRSHLQAALASCPPDAAVAGLGAVIEPLVRRGVSASMESRSLAKVRDLLLPRLMSGGIRIHGIDSFARRIIS